MPIVEELIEDEISGANYVSLNEQGIVFEKLLPCKNRQSVYDSFPPVTVNRFPSHRQSLVWLNVIYHHNRIVFFSFLQSYLL